MRLLTFLGGLGRFLGGGNAMFLINVRLHDGFRSHYFGLFGRYESEQEAIADLLAHGFVEVDQWHNYQKNLSFPRDSQAYLASIFDMSKLKKIDM